LSGLEQWLAGVPSWMVYLVSFGFVFAESAIFAGFLIPGETALLAAGVLAGLGHVNVVAVAACAAAGALLGDSVGYEVGRHFGPRLRSTRLGRRVKAAHWDRAEAFMRRYGGRSVFLGRWAAFGRALIPALAGVTRMRYPTFVLWNALGGLTWAVTVVALGFFAGGSWHRVEQVFGRAVGLVLLTVVVVALMVAGARWVARHPQRVRSWAGRQATRPRVGALLGRYDRQVVWLGRRLRPNSAFALGLTGGLVLVGAAGWAFGAVVQAVLAGQEAVRFDLPVLLWFVDHREATLTQVMSIVQGLTSVGAALAAPAGARPPAGAGRRRGPGADADRRARRRPRRTSSPVRGHRLVRTRVVPGARGHRDHRGGRGAGRAGVPDRKELGPGGHRLHCRAAVGRWGRPVRRIPGHALAD
jgi:membrane protein DedA with SNARE-associated domain